MASLLVTSSLLAAVVAGNPSNHRTRSTCNTTLTSDINKISLSWGQISPYSENPDNYFGVQNVGMPSGCQIEQVHTLQRHAQREPITYEDDGVNNERFAAKVADFVANGTAGFIGPLEFLNSYSYRMTTEGYLMGSGAAAEVAAGASFWAKYGRLLYNATIGQLAYDATFTNGTSKPKPVLRTTSQARMEDSMLNWALGFFGSTVMTTPDLSLSNATEAYETVIITEGGTENNTLASYDSCTNEYATDAVGYLGDNLVWTYLPKYLKPATARMQQYAPQGFTFTVNDTYAMQTICAYEIAYLTTSDFCGLFTEDEWAGFENTLDIAYYFDYGYGNPTGRAQGIGYTQELLARLQNQYLTTSSTSVNSTLDSSPTTFPLHQPFYADFTHDDIIISVLTSLSLDYFKIPPTLTAFPPDPSRPFILSHMTPFSANLITEVIGCSSSNPTEVEKARTQYTATQYGYDAANATNKFVRMRLNGGILPLESIRGGGCEGRGDGLCGLESFVESQRGSEELANYQYVCFGEWNITDALSGKDYDGTIFE